MELLGTEEDWRNLLVKLRDIRKVLAPISAPLGNITNYFDTIVEPVYRQLLDTFLGRPNTTWWNDIVLRQAKVEQVNWANGKCRVMKPVYSFQSFEIKILRYFVKLYL